jgi:hypothetical protein
MTIHRFTAIAGIVLFAAAPAATFAAPTAMPSPTSSAVPTNTVAQCKEEARTARKADVKTENATLKVDLKAALALKTKAERKVARKKALATFNQSDKDSLVKETAAKKACK